MTPLRIPIRFSLLLLLTQLSFIDRSNNLALAFFFPSQHTRVLTKSFVGAVCIAFLILIYSPLSPVAYPNTTVSTPSQVLLSGRSDTRRIAAVAMSSGGLADIGKGSGATQSSSSSSSSAENGHLPQWRIDLDKSLDVNAKDVHSRFMQLATVRKVPEDGSIRPACRWVVFRGFLDGTEVLCGREREKETVSALHRSLV